MVSHQAVISTAVHDVEWALWDQGRPMPMILIQKETTDITRLAVPVRPIAQRRIQLVYTLLSAGKSNCGPSRSQWLIGSVWSVNLAATLANYGVPHYAKYAKINPHMTEEGRYPQEFNLPKTVDQMKVLDSKWTRSSALVMSFPGVLKILCTRIPMLSARDI